MRFRDRHDAGHRLATALAREQLTEPVVLALPRGGVPVAAEVATALHAPLDVFVARKIGAGIADTVVCVAAPPDFMSVGPWYEDFRQTTDDEVVELLARFHAPAGGC
jgi:putative phosphoribosyl transferase